MTDEINYCPMHKAAPSLVEVLKDAYGAIATLDNYALGISYTDDKQPYPIRDELLHNIAKAIAQAGGDA